MTTALILALLWLIAPVSAHDHATMTAGSFYDTWKRPIAGDDRLRRHYGCCDNRHCSPVTVFKRGGQWYATDHQVFPVEILLPPDILEHNQPDARESPDGRSHACLQLLAGSVTVLCAVLGSGQ